MAKFAGTGTVLGSNTVAARLFMASFLGFLCYRVALWVHLYTDPITPLGFIADHRRGFASLRVVADDCVLAGLLALAIWGLERLLPRRRPLVVAFSLLVLFMLGLTTGSHFGLLRDLHAGLGIDLLTANLAENSLPSMFA
jgi:hypothetical protein